MDALKKINYKINKFKIKKKIILDLYVIKYNSLGKMTNSQPCYNCAKELYNNKKIKISKLFFSNSDGTITKVNFDEWFLNTEHHISRGWLNCSKHH